MPAAPATPTASSRRRTSSTSTCRRRSRSRAPNPTPPTPGRGRSPACSRATGSSSASSRRSASQRSSSALPRCNDPQVLYGVHTGPGAFYALMPHNAMAALFGAAFLYAILALVMGVRAFWRDIGEPVGMRADAPSLWQAIRDAGELRYLDGGGVGCFNEDERPTDRRRILSPSDLLRLPALLRRDLRRRRSITICWRARRPMRGGTCRWCSARSAASGC